MKTIKDKEYSFKHTRDRIKQRYDRTVSREWYDNMCTRLGKCEGDWSVLDTDGSQIIIELELQFTDNIIVVWDNKKKYITTALKDWRINEFNNEKTKNSNTACRT